MAHILEIPGLTNPTPEDIESRWKAYQDYILSVRESLGRNAFEYATSEWHRDYTHRHSPHDGWLEEVRIEEPSTGARREERSMRVVISLLAAGHDGRIRFRYPAVRSYKLEAPPDSEWPPADAGHGDWLADEVCVSERGLVMHEVLFSRGAKWSIEARDVIYEWCPL